MADFPTTTGNILSSKSTSSVNERSILLIASMVSGTATSGELVENLISETDFNNKFGKTSQIAKAGRALIKKLSISRKKPLISAIGLADNGSGTPADGAIVFSGTATKAGTIKIYIDSIFNGKFEIGVAVGDTATVVGGKLATAINAYQYKVVNAVNTSGSVALTAINKGTEGNTIGLKYDLGLTTGLSISITEMANGATNPSLTGLFDSISSTRYTTIVFPSTWDLSVLTNLTENRFNVDNKILDGVGLVCGLDTYDNIFDLVNDYNYKTLAYIPNNLVDKSSHKGGAIFESPIVIASVVAGIRDLRLTIDSNTSTLSTSAEAIGGSYFASVPYHNTPVDLLPIIETGNDFTDAQALSLENAGCWLFRNNSARTKIISNEAVTTYKTNDLGSVDKTFKYLNYIDTISIVREFICNNLQETFSQYRLTTGDLIAGRKMVNKEGFINHMQTLYSILSGYKTGNNNYVLLRSGDLEAEAFRKEMEETITVSLVEGRITSDVIANIVTQLRSIIINFIPTFE